MSAEDARKGTIIAKKTVSILDKALPKTRKELNMSTFSFLFSEIVQYCQSRVTDAADLEKRLMTVGFDIGSRYLELGMFRDKKTREIKLVQLLQWISTTVWKSLFNKQADSLEKSQQKETQCMNLIGLIFAKDLIYDKEPMETKFISVPKGVNLHVAYFTAGILKGILCAAEFVQKHNDNNILGL